MYKIPTLIILSVLLLYGCAANKWVRTPVAKEYDLSVVLEQPQDHEQSVAQRQGQTPAIDLAELKKLLGDLSYTEKAGLMSKGPQAAAVFQQEEIDRLAPVLAASLVKVDTSQRLRFISFNKGQGALLADSRKTEGVVFFDPAARFNIAFNYINARRLPSESSAIYVSFAAVDPLSITTSDTPLQETLAYAELQRTQGGESAPMWLAVNLDRLRAALQAAPPPAPSPMPAGKASEAVPSAPAAKAAPEMAPATAPAPAPSPVPAGKTTEAATPPPAAKAAPEMAPATRPAPAPSPQEQLQQEIRSKLKYLKGLLDEGLISTQDYEAKKSELLRKLD